FTGTRKGNGLTRMNILIVEDNEINAKLLNIMLKELKFIDHTHIASDAKTAIAASVKTHFDIVLMDINLGDGQMDGIETMKVLKSREDYKEIPIYAITCYSLPGDREKFLKEGFDRYFSKPVSQEQLLESIREDYKSSVS
ncbi:MAG: response regulator, partial [Bacteroidota bacterium]